MTSLFGGPDEVSATAYRDNEDIKAQLRAEFPRWSIVHTTDTNRWWAIRTPGRARLDGRPLSSRVPTELDADTADELRAKLRAVAEAEAGAR
ncbi:hypothetical protein [Actinomadura rubrisoli]|uniref:Uncharacterized protein n=1 Tax=Actinomadura rubrisoli TaxID=2530368 RepID=A0A4R5AY55_9ACTN|nr:hypothetical protein [Actinomadura rubrisoli]TDD76164.1 hypothetical protein E1298_31085 [Actinomadura rubrisoli]